MSQDFPQLPTSDESISPDTLTDAPLPAAQLAAIDLLLTGASDTSVANSLGIDRRTLYNWKHRNPAFARALAARRADFFDHAADRFRALLDTALSTLAKQIADPWATTAHRAAKTLLTLAKIQPPETTDGLSPAPSPRRADQFR